MGSGSPGVRSCRLHSDVTINGDRFRLKGAWRALGVVGGTSLSPLNGRFVRLRIGRGFGFFLYGRFSWFSYMMEIVSYYFMYVYI